MLRRKLLSLEAQKQRPQDLRRAVDPIPGKKKEKKVETVRGVVVSSIQKRGSRR